MSSSPGSGSSSSSSSDETPAAPRNSAANCTTFEPQQWRRTICKNCFRTEDRHRGATGTGSGSDESTEDAETSSSGSEVGAELASSASAGSTPAVRGYIYQRSEQPSSGSAGSGSTVSGPSASDQEDTAESDSEDSSIDEIVSVDSPSTGELETFGSDVDKDVGPLRVFVAGGQRTCSPGGGGRPSVSRGGGSAEKAAAAARAAAMMEEGAVKHDRGYVVSGSCAAPGAATAAADSNVASLREKVAVMDERNAQLDREKSALAELLAAKKREYDQMRQHYRDRINDLEEETQRLKAEKLRLVDKLQLPESERTSLVAQENEIAKLRRRLDEAESRCAEAVDENAELKREVKDLQLEIEEMHDQFRDEETAEFRELQRELESTAKACRIVNFKLRKAERRCEQLEAERVQAEEKARLLEARFRSSDDRQHVLELEEELRMAKEVSVRLHDDVEAVEEKRARYEEELDRVNDLLTQSETRRQTLQKEVDMLIDQLKRHQPGSPSGAGKTLELPKMTSTPTTLTKQGSQEIDVSQLMRDLNDSLERENDLREQLRFSEEETKVMRKKLSDVEDENEGLTMQLHKLSTAKSGRFVPALRKAGDGDSTSEAAASEREQELRLQMELAEQEVKVLRRKMDDMERSYDVLVDEVKSMRVRVEGKDSHHGGAQSGQQGTPGSSDDAGKTSAEKFDELVRDIERLKWKLIEKDKDADKLRSARKGIGGGGNTLQKSRSLEEGDTGGSSDPYHHSTYHHEYHQDLRMQLETVQQEAKVLQDKLSDTVRINEQLVTENKKLQILSGRTTSSSASSAARNAAASKGEDDARARVRDLEAENAVLRERVSQLDERTNALSKEIVRAKFRGQQQVELSLSDSPGGTTGAESSEASAAWRELRAHVQFLDDECRTLRRKVVDMEAERSRLKLELKHARGETDPGEKDKLLELDKEPKERLKQRILELENELADMAAVVRNREEDAERLSEEVADNREDLNRMLETFRRRERELLDDMETLQHKNATLSDLLDLVTERAESTQKELDRCRAGGVLGTAGSDVTAGGSDVIIGPATADVTLQKEWERRVLALERQLGEEKIRVQAAEKKLKMIDVPLSEVKDDTRLRQHEKEILVQELALCQKQLKAANEQISDLKERLLTVRESHDDIKEDFAKVSKELAEVREQKEAAGRGPTARSPVGLQPTGTMRFGASVAGAKVEREPASWRWEKQELERQLKDYKKKLDDIHSEMKRNQSKWKAAGEDIARETQIKEELEKKIDKLREQSELNKQDAEQNKVKVEELQESLRRKEKQWDKEKQILEADKMAAETDARQKDDVIRSKDELIAQKNTLVAEKDAALRVRLESIQQKEQQLQQKDVELEFKDRELRMRTDEVTTFRSELNEFRAHLAERDERIRQLDEHMRRRDDRLKEKDDILQQINRRLVEKANQVSDMDKTIRQVIRKLQARDVDLGLCNAELRRVQAELKTSQERLAELRRYADAVEADIKCQAVDYEARLRTLNAELESLHVERTTLQEQLRQMEDEFNRKEVTWKADNDKLQVELKLTAERLHAQDVATTMNQTDAYRLMMREKETLISEKYKLTDSVNTLKRQIKAADDRRKVDKDLYDRTLEEKTKALQDIAASRERMQKELARARAGGASSISVGGTSSGGEPLSSSVDAVARSELERRERQWLAETATLEEFYESAARNQRDAVAQLREAAAALRRENDIQLQLLQAARRALGDLRNRFDMSAASWAEERLRLQTAAEPVDRYRQRIGELEKSVDRITSDLKAMEAKRKEVENRLMAQESEWKMERTDLEEKARKAAELAAVADSKSPSSSSASTRVSEFRSKFEKFGSSKSKKSIDSDQQQQQQRKAELDALELNKDLQRQLAEAEQIHAQDRKQLLSRLDELRSGLEKENREFRERNSELEKKARELTQVQRTVVDLQCRLLDDRNQWQLEVSQMQRHLEESQRHRLQQKESIGQLLAEIARLRVLIGGLDSSLGVAAESASHLGVKPRLRSLTPSAEKLRVQQAGVTGATASLQQQRSTNGGADDEENNGKKTIDQIALQDLLQAIEVTSRLAEELSQPVQMTSRGDQQRQQQQLGSTFKRSQSTAEVEMSSSRYGATPSAADSLLFPSSAVSHYAAPRGVSSSSGVTSSSGGSGRWGLIRSSSQDEAESSSGRRTTSGGSAGLAPISPPSTSSTFRSSIYASGTQSAYGSRDASPDTSGRTASAGGAARRITAYPLAPPSMIITPSHTPTRRAASVEPEGELPLTSDDIVRLYEKLNAIERETEMDISLAKAAGSTSSSSAADRRGRTMLKSSSSAGISAQQQPSPTVGNGARPQLQATSGGTTQTGSSGGSAAKTSTRSLSVSPRSARRQFYDDYPYDPNRRGVDAGRPDATLSAAASPAEAASAPRSSSVSRDDPSGGKSKLSSAASSFFQTIKDKRKLFGAKKSASVDTATQASIARIGANVLTEPAAPSTYQPPAIPDPPPTRSRSRFGFRRSTSVDVETGSDGRGASKDRSSSVTREGKR